MARLELKRLSMKPASDRPKPRPFKLCGKCGNLMHVASTRDCIRYFKCHWCGDTGKQVK